MLEFDYSIDYKNTLFETNDKRYRIGRGEQGVLLVRPYTDDICRYWRFKTPHEAKISAAKILNLYNTYKTKSDFVGMDMCRKFLEMGFTRARKLRAFKHSERLLASLHAEVLEDEHGRHDETVANDCKAADQSRRESTKL